MSLTVKRVVAVAVLSVYFVQESSRVSDVALHRTPLSCKEPFRQVVKMFHLLVSRPPDIPPYVVRVDHVCSTSPKAGKHICFPSFFFFRCCRWFGGF